MSMFSRLNLYCKEMFPLPLYIPYAAMTFFGLYLSVRGMMGVTKLNITYPAITGLFTVFALSLLMRIFDEFKDLEVDKVLFPHRAVARGAVHTTDLKYLGITLVALMFLLNIRLEWVIWPFITTLIFGFLTFQWFFIKNILSTNLLLALVTHQPMGLLVNTYAASTAIFSVGLSYTTLQNTWVIAAILAYFFPVTAWETARKIRAPSQETDYVTYSKVLGPRLACCLPMVFITLSGVLLIQLSHQLELSTTLPWLIATALFLHTLVCLRFIIKLDARSNIIKAATELACAVLQLSFLVALLIQFHTGR